MIETHGLFAGYGTARVLRNIALALAPGRVTGLLGPNGSGKSTLLRALARLHPPTRGSVRLDGRDLYREVTARAAARRIALVPQEERHAVPLTVRELAALGRTPYLGRWGWPGRADRIAVDRALAGMDLTAAAERGVADLSGGERKRAVVARALAQEAGVLLLDEPTAHLDVRHALDLFGLLRGLAAGGRAVLVASHELWQLARFCDGLVLLDRGHVTATGTPARVLGSGAAARAFGVRFRLVRAGGRLVAVAPR